MQRRLTNLRARRAAGEHGFTLIELLVVVVIIGILIAIAIPVYLNYEKGAHDASAASDVRSAIPTLDLCNADYGTFPDHVPAAGGRLDKTCPDQQINVTPGTTLFYVLSTKVPQSYVLLGSNSGGTGKVYCYNSAVGGSVVAMSTTGRSIIDLAAARPEQLASVISKESTQLCLSALKGDLPPATNTRD